MQHSNSAFSGSDASGAEARRLVIVPRWGGTPASDFYPWLRDQLLREHPRRFASVEVLDMPQPQAPVIRAWVDAVAHAIGGDGAAGARTVLMGHSVGFQAVLRALAERPEGRAVQAVLGVAGWFTVDRPWPSLLPWIETPLEEARVRRAARRLRVLISNNDPFTTDSRETERRLVERLGAEVEVLSGALHFNATEEPSVLRALLDLTAAS